MALKKHGRDIDDDLINNNNNGPPLKKAKPNVQPLTMDEINPSVLREDINEMMQNMDGKLSAQIGNLDDLLCEWNGYAQRQQFGNADCSKMCKIDARNLKMEDFELMRQITEVALESMPQIEAVLHHSTRCTNVFLRKLGNEREKKKRQFEEEKKECDEALFIPSKDIWSQSERITYLKEGNRAAIKTKMANSTQSRYIVCRIVSVKHEQRECVLIDEENHRVKYTQTFTNILPLPSIHSVSLSKRTIFRVGTKVLAIYPSTTCFYSAVIIKPAKPNQTKYTLCFDDDGRKTKDIGAENVIPFLS